MSFAAIPGDLGLLPREVFGALFPMFLDNSNPNSRAVLGGIWGINQVRQSNYRKSWKGQSLRHITLCIRESLA
jgi:hypothetical protein